MNRLYLSPPGSAGRAELFPEAMPATGLLVGRMSMRSSGGSRRAVGMAHAAALSSGRRRCTWR